MILKKNGITSFKTFAKGFGVCLFVLLNVLLFPAQSQDQSNFTQFYLNPYVLNSSYAGFDGQPSISLIYRKQWMTIVGAPTITNLSIHAPLNARVSAGVNITNDSKGFFNNSALLFSLAYHVAIQDNAFVRFGISAGGSWNTVDMKKLEAINDPALSSVLDQNASLAGNAGVSLHLKFFNLGIALPSLFSPAYVSRDAFSVREVKPFQALILHASNRFYFNNNKNIFEPYALYRINTGLPAQFEFAGIVHLNHVVWTGASCKQDFGVSVLGGIKMKNMLAIGASYSIQESGTEELNSPSFEVSLNYLFGQHKRGAPVYSFVNAVKAKERTQTGAARQAIAARQQQAEEQKRKADAAAKLKQEQLDEKKRIAAQSELRQKEAQKIKLETEARLKQEGEEKKRLDEREKSSVVEAAKQKSAESEEAKRLAEGARIAQEAKIRESEERAKQDQDAVARKNAEGQPQGEANAVLKKQEKLGVEEIRQKQLAKEIVQQHPPQPDSAPTANVPEEGNPQHEHEQLQRLETHAENPTLPIEDHTKIAYTVRHEFVKRGNHAEELDVSDYVIVGVFKSPDNAKDFSNGLRSLNFNTHYGHLTEKDIWYVYLFKTTDIEQARAEQVRVSKLFLLRDAWLLTVLP